MFAPGVCDCTCATATAMLRSASKKGRMLKPCCIEVFAMCTAATFLLRFARLLVLAFAPTQRERHFLSWPYERIIAISIFLQHSMSLIQMFIARNRCSNVSLHSPASSLGNVCASPFRRNFGVQNRCCSYIMST